MVLSNVDIVKALKNGAFKIEGLEYSEPSEKPFNTSAVDLRLGNEVTVPFSDVPVQLDLRKGNIAKLWAMHSKQITITEDQPFVLKQNQFVLANTFEKVSFPLTPDAQCYSARVEGKSSLARCGVLIHFTAPTIHSGWYGPITLEMMNLGPMEFLLFPKMYICQLIVEEVSGCPADAPNQFKGQKSPAGQVTPKSAETRASEK